jgi:hypothetical protein
MKWIRTLNRRFQARIPTQKKKMRASANMEYLPGSNVVKISG